MLRKTVSEHKDWSCVLDLVLLFLRNLPHSRHGYMPFELTFMKPTPHILSTLQYCWLSPDDSADVPRFIADLDSNLTCVLQSVKERLNDKVVANRAATEHKSLRVFQTGDTVMKRVPGLNASLVHL